MSKDYVPPLEEVLNSKTGICYNYAALFAGMLMKEYHAWNEVLIDGNWVIIDMTYDAALNKLKNKPSMYKKMNKYNKQREY